MCLCHALASGTRSLGCCSNSFTSIGKNKEKYPIDLVIFLKANNPKVRLNLVIYFASYKVILPTLDYVQMSRKNCLIYWKFLVVFPFEIDE